MIINGFCYIPPFIHHKLPQTLLKVAFLDNPCKGSFLQQLLFDNHMNTSNAFSDYMVTYSVNRSINLSPTSGRLHRQKDRGSYGPTICLLNRSREKIEESTEPENKEEVALLERVFMLSLEVERLGQALREARAEGEERMARSKHRETAILKQENQKLRMGLAREESLHALHQKSLQDELFQLKQKLTLAEAQGRALTRRLHESEQLVAELQRRGKASESVAERAKLQASRMEMSMHFNSTNIDLHRSVAREKALQAQALRERVARCQDIINDQKFLIAGQKEELTREKGRQLEMENRHGAELEYLRKQLQFTQRELMTRVEEQARRWEGQVHEWRLRAGEAEEQLRQKTILIANLQQTISEHQQKNTELSNKIHDIQFSSHSQVIRAEQALKLAGKQRDRQQKRLAKQLQRLTDQNQQMRKAIEQYKLALEEKHNEVEQSHAEATLRLRQKDKEMRRFAKRTKEEAEAKLNKSLSVDNSLVSNRLKASQVNLESIVSSVLDLRTSNERTSKLITKSIAPVRDIYYAK